MNKVSVMLIYIVVYNKKFVKKEDHLDKHALKK